MHRETCLINMTMYESLYRSMHIICFTLANLLMMAGLIFMGLVMYRHPTNHALVPITRNNALGCVMCKT